MKSVTLNEIANNLEGSYDIFIAAASFEERSLSVTNSVVSKIKFNSKYVAAVKHNRSVFETILKKFVDDYGFDTIDVDSLDQLYTVDNFLTVINSTLLANPNASFLIDISTFTRQTILILARLLRNNLSKNNNRVDLVYSSASDYAIGLKEGDKWLSKGVRSVHSVFGYVGTMFPSRSYHLIILMGYEVERAVSLIDAYEPAKITIGFASRESSLSEEHYQLNKNRFEKLLENYPFAEKFEFSCVDTDSVNTIIKQAQKYPDYNVVISPMHNKISTLFLAAATFINKDIQVAIAIPIIYNYEGYSSAGDSCLIINGSELLLK